MSATHCGRVARRAGLDRASARCARVHPRVLRRCLDKDRRKRIGDIAAALFAIDEALSSSAEGPNQAGPYERDRDLPLWRRALPYAAAVGIAAAGAGYAAWVLKPAPEAAVTRFTITLPEGESFTSSPANRHLVALSPDGSRLVYAANDRLYLRALDELDGTPIRGTEGTGNASPRSPFFSFDGQWIGFWSGGQLKKVSVSGGAPVTLCATQNPFGASWAADDTTYSAGAAGIWRSLEEAAILRTSSSSMRNNGRWGPQMLPDGRTICSRSSPGPGAMDKAQIVAHSLDTGVRTMLISAGRRAVPPTGHIVMCFGHAAGGAFDSESRQVTAGPCRWLKTCGKQPSPALRISAFQPTARSHTYPTFRPKRAAHARVGRPPRA